MKRLILHSDQINDNIKLDEAFIKFIGKKNPTITYIPSQVDPQKTYYNDKKEYYEQFGITNLHYFDIDHDFDESSLEKVFSSDAIFLSGGNTYYFLNSMKKCNLIPLIQEYISNGGILISAGSILMSDTIEITHLFDHYEGDRNHVGISDLSALGFNKFHFLPHFNKDDNVLFKKALEFSKMNDKVIYACNDGDGLIINDDEIQFIGDIYKIEKGEISLLEK